MQLAIHPLVTIASLAMLRLLLLHPGTAPRGELRYRPAAQRFAVALALAVPFTLVAALLLHAGPLGAGDIARILEALVFPTVIAVPLVLEFCRVRHRYDDEAIAFCSPWSRDRQVRWADIVLLRWRRGRWISASTAAGEVLHVWPMVGGVEAFAQVALRRLSPQALQASPAAAQLLLALSEGRAKQLLVGF